MQDAKLSVRFCGFGGQGIVLAAVIFGTTAVVKARLNAVQMQSYGSEARGGECQAEVIVSPAEINSPLADQMDVLVAMSQPALDKFLPTLRAEGTLIYDPELVSLSGPGPAKAVALPATRIASELGAKLAANMVMLGCLQELLQIFSFEDLEEVIAANIPARFVEVNIAAARAGRRYGRRLGSGLG